MCLPAIVGWTKLGLWKSAIPFFPYLILTDNFGRNKTRAKLFRRFWSELYMPSFASQYLAGQILNFQIKGLWILLRKQCVSQNSATFTGLLVANVSGWQIHNGFSTSRKVSHLPFTTSLCHGARRSNLLSPSLEFRLVFPCPCRLNEIWPLLWSPL